MGAVEHAHVGTPANALSQEQLTELLMSRGVELAIEGSLKGGVVSQVYSARDPAGHRLVVKHTTDWVDEDPTMITVSRQGQNVDARVLDYLANESKVRVPRVLHHFADVPVTVMEDLRASSFRLLSESLLEGNLPLESAAGVGRDIALMHLSLGRCRKFATNESAWESYYERGLELRLAYPNDRRWYSTLEHRFTTSNQQLIAVDTHPKNMFVDPWGNLAWIDFGRSVWADRDFALPNCLAHIALYCLTGRIDGRVGATYISDAVASYRQFLPIEDAVFCTYFAGEILHRWAGKWITGIETADEKIAVLRRGLLIFDQEVFAIGRLLQLLAD